MSVVYKLVAALCILAPAVAGASKMSMENLDVPFLSKLRSEAKWAQPTEQCALFLSGIRDKLTLVAPEVGGLRFGQEDENRLVDRNDLELLGEVHKMLSNLANFTENCISILSDSQDQDGGTTVGPTLESAEIAATETVDIDREDEASQVGFKQQVSREMLEMWLAESREEAEQLKNLMEANGGEFRNCKADLQTVRESMSELESDFESRLRDVEREANQMNAKREPQPCDQQLLARTSERDFLLKDNERLREQMKAFRAN